MSSDYALGLTAASSRKPTMTLLLGAAGTGKTRCSLEAALKNPEIKQIVIIRKPLAFGAGYGFLPGTLDEKVEPWAKNIEKLCDDLGYNANQLKSSGKLVYASFEHIGGMTFDNAFIIIDEAQLCTWDELYVVCSRVGQYSWVTLTGDTLQKGSNVKDSGWDKLVRHVYDSKLATMQVIEFKDTNYRSELCGEVNKLFGR
jgi:phosphate starvation-inducible PhoH-like protein